MVRVHSYHSTLCEARSLTVKVVITVHELRITRSTPNRSSTGCSPPSKFNIQSILSWLRLAGTPGPSGGRTLRVGLLRCPPELHQLPPQPARRRPQQRGLRVHPQHGRVVRRSLSQLPSPRCLPENVSTLWSHLEQLLFVGCLTFQQHASVSQGRICSDSFTCCHTEIEVADQTLHLIQSQYTDTGPTNPSTNPITPGA